MHRRFRRKPRKVFKGQKWKASFVRWYTIAMAALRAFASMGTVVSLVLTTEQEQKSKLCSSARWEVENETQSQVLWRKSLLTSKGDCKENCLFLARKWGERVAFWEFITIVLSFHGSGPRYSLHIWSRKPQKKKHNIYGPGLVPTQST